MRSYIVWLLLAISVTTACFLHTWKIDHTIDDMDGPIEKIGQLKASIYPGSRISFRSKGTRSEMFLWARYALVPSLVRLSKPLASTDTLLTVVSRSAPDSLSTTEQTIVATSDSFNTYRLSTFP